MQLSEELIDCMQSNGIQTVFGIPGTQSLPLNEEISDRNDIEFVMARHETAVPHQAWGYAETSDQMAATVVIPGPGDMNSMNGLKNALNDSTPLLHIAIETDPEIRGTDGIHETPPDTYDNVVKENILVETPESAVSEIQHAISVAQSHPKGPVRVGIPKSFLTQDVSYCRSGDDTPAAAKRAPDDAVTDAVEALSAAESPLIIAGGGVRASGAEEELLAVAERLDAPVVPTYKGKGVFPEDHDLFAGILSVGTTANLYECIADSDAVLGVGTDFDAVTTQRWQAELPDDLVHVTMHPADLGTGYKPSVGIVADAKQTLSAFDDALAETSVSGRDGAERAATVREADAELMADVRAVSEPPLTSASAEAALDEVLPDDAVVSVDAGGFRIWSLFSITMRDSRQFVDTGSWATMGTGLPAAIGAKKANPDLPVVALTGGGGLMMCMQELHTAATENIPVVTVILNNDDYATISAEAASSFDLGEGAYRWDERPVRFTGVAESLGVKAVEATTPTDIREAVETALASDEPTLIEVPTDPNEPQAKPLD